VRIRVKAKAGERLKTGKSQGTMLRLGLMRGSTWCEAGTGEKICRDN
jgi:hypothetical protein